MNKSADIESVIRPNAPPQRQRDEQRHEAVGQHAGQIDLDNRALGLVANINRLSVEYRQLLWPLITKYHELYQEGAGKLEMGNEAIRTKKDIVSIIQKKQREIKTLGVKKLGLFGSFVRDEQHAESDIDLLVEFEPGQKTFDNFIQLSFLLEDSLLHPIELVTTESLSPYIRPYIIKEVEYVTFTA